MEKITIMKKLIYLFLLFSAISNAQNRGYKTIEKVIGDLNKDGFPDLVTVEKNSQNSHILKIFFNYKNIKYNYFTMSTTVIDGEANNGEGDGLSIEIKNNVLLINNGYNLTGNEQHKFRFQNNHFELIGYTNHYSDRHGTITTEDFNLMTGIRIVEEEDMNTGKITKNKTYIKLNSRPNLSNFSSSNNGYY